MDFLTRDLTLPAWGYAILATMAVLAGMFVQWDVTKHSFRFLKEENKILRRMVGYKGEEDQ